MKVVKIKARSYIYLLHHRTCSVMTALKRQTSKNSWNFSGGGDETMRGRRAAGGDGGGTHHVRRFGELVVGLAGLEAPGHRGPGADHLAGLEGTSQDSFGAVLNDHLRVGVDIDGRCRFCHCKINKQTKINTLKWNRDVPVSSNRAETNMFCTFSFGSAETHLALSTDALKQARTQTMTWCRKLFDCYVSLQELRLVWCQNNKQLNCELFLKESAEGQRKGRLFSLKITNKFSF